MSSGITVGGQQGVKALVVGSGLAAAQLDADSVRLSSTATSLTAAETAAIAGAASPSGSNVFATMADIPTVPAADAALVTVAHAAPTTFVTPLVFDDSATTGGLYAWDGAAYQKVGLATS